MAGEKILVVDDEPDAREILTARLRSEGYLVTAAADGHEALEVIEVESPDLVLLDLVMPRIDGLETLSRIKAREDGFLPTILVTARSDAEDVVKGLELGADEYIVKPFDHAALVARVRAMLRLKALHDEIAELNASLERRVQRQVDEIQRVSRLKRFLAPQVAEAILASPDATTALESHRREVAVLICDIRGFTAFAEASPPGELMSFLHDYHDVVGRAVFAHGGTIERFAGDAVLAIFNDPIEMADYKARAIMLGLDLVTETRKLISERKGARTPLGVGVGIAAGPATLGRIGFSERLDYAAIGPVTNLAARLSSAADAWQILADSAIASEAYATAKVTSLAPITMKGFAEPMAVFELGRR